MIKVFLTSLAPSNIEGIRKFPTATDWTFTSEDTVIVWAQSKALVELPRNNVLFIERIEEEEVTETGAESGVGVEFTEPPIISGGVVLQVLETTAFNSSPNVLYFTDPSGQIYKARIE